eukprot:245623-Hanusia_phi.AAC.1
MGVRTHELRSFNSNLVPKLEIPKANGPEAGNQLTHDDQAFEDFYSDPLVYHGQVPLNLSLRIS